MNKELLGLRPHMCVLQDSPIHKFLFWVAISVLQLDEVSLYAAGLALLEQNLHTLDNMGLFDRKVRLTPLLLLLQCSMFMAVLNLWSQSVDHLPGVVDRFGMQGCILWPNVLTHLFSDTVFKAAS